MFGIGEFLVGIISGFLKFLSENIFFESLAVVFLIALSYILIEIVHSTWKKYKVKKAKKIENTRLREKREKDILYKKASYLSSINLLREEDQNFFKYLTELEKDISFSDMRILRDDAPRIFNKTHDILNSSGLSSFNCLKVSLHNGGTTLHFLFDPIFLEVLETKFKK